MGHPLLENIELESVLPQAETVEQVSQIFIDGLQLNARAFALLLCCFLLFGLLFRFLKTSAANKHLYFSLSLFATALIPCLLGSLAPLEFTVQTPIQSQAFQQVVPKFLLPAISVSPESVSPSGLQLSAVEWTLYLAALVYLSGVVFFLIKILWSNFAISLVTAAAIPCCDQQWQKALEQHTLRFWLRKPIELRYSYGVSSPMTWGFLRPVILIPVSARYWSPELINSTLLHELAHIKRSDWLVQQILRCVCAVYWINPLSWIALKKLGANAELAADDMALQSGYQKSCYAQSLLTVAEGSCDSSAGSAPGSAVLAMAAKRSELGQRISAILNPSGLHTPVNHWIAGSAFVLVLGGVLPFSSLEAKFLQQSTVVDSSVIVSDDLVVSESVEESDQKNYYRLILGSNRLIVSNENIRPTPVVEKIDVLPQSELGRSAENRLTKTAVQTAKQTTKEITAVEVIKLAGESLTKRFSGESSSIENKVTNISVKNSESNKVKDEQINNVELAINSVTSPAADEAAATTTPTSVDAPQTLADYLRTASGNNSASAQMVSYQPRQVRPKYPSAAQRRGIEGEVVVEFNIGANGEVVDARIIRAQPEGVFDRAVIRALEQSSYRPQMVEGKAVNVRGVQEVYKFVLET